MMVAPAPEQLAEMIRSDVRQGDVPALERTVRSSHPADLAAALHELTLPEALAVFSRLETSYAAEVLDELDPTLTQYLADHVAADRMADLLDRLPMDDAAEVVAEADPARSAALLTDLERIAPEDAAEVRTLLSYPDNSAGRLMTDKFATVPPTVTAEQTLRYLRTNAHVLESVDALYVTDAEQRLLGMVPLRTLLTAGEWQTVGSIMGRSPSWVTPDTSQEETARRIARYDLSAIPVVGTGNRLLGIVTVDDAIDVLVEEFTEDYLHLAGTDAEATERRSPAQNARLRLPWLLGTMGIELLSGLVIAHFSGVLQQVILLASFMPVISAVSGNVGLQAAAMVVRGLDSGFVTLHRWPRQVWRELLSSFLLGLACAIVLGGIGSVWAHRLSFGIVVGVALLCSMLTAGFMGTVVPMTSKRIGFDPATTAGPFETAFQDVIGFAVFLWLASLLLSILH